MQATFVVPASTEIPVGITVRTDFCIYRGRECYRAVHKRDGNATWQKIIDSPGADTGHQAVLTAWVAEFAGKDSNGGFNSDFEVVARGSDFNGYYWVLVPTKFY